MSTAMESIEKAIRNKKGILIVISAARTMEHWLPIRVKFVDNVGNEILQPTAHHDEELTLEVNMKQHIAYVCNRERTRVRVTSLVDTSSVSDGLPAYAFISKHVVSSLYDEMDFMLDENGVVHKEEANPFTNEW